MYSPYTVMLHFETGGFVPTATILKPQRYFHWTVAQMAIFVSGSGHHYYKEIGVGFSTGHHFPNKKNMRN